jgi:hypothetical protein
MLPSGFLVASVVLFGALPARERLESSNRHRGIKHQHRKCSEDAVAPEQSRKPGDARHYEGALGGVLHDGGEVGRGSAEKIVQRLAARGDAAPAGVVAGNLQAPLRQHSREFNRPLRLRCGFLAPTGDLNFHRALLVGLQRDPERRTAVLKLGRFGIEREAGKPLLAVESLILESDPIARDFGLVEVSAPRAPDATDLEEISEVRVKQEIERNLDRKPRKVSDHHLVAQLGSGDHPISLDLDRVDRKRGVVSVDAEIGIAQVDVQLCVLARDVRVEVVRRLARHLQLKAAQMSGIAMEKTQRLVRSFEHIAAGFEDRKAVTIHQ